MVVQQDDEGDGQDGENAAVNEFTVLLEEQFGFGDGLSYILLTHFFFSFCNFSHIVIVSN